MAEETEKIIISDSPIMVTDPEEVREELEQMRMCDTSKSPSVKSRKSSMGPGYQHTLTNDQRSSLYILWRMIFGYLLTDREDNNTDLQKTAKCLLAETSSVELNMGRLKESSKLFQLLRQSASDDLDTVLLRFLRARKWNLEATFVIVIEWLEWTEKINTMDIVKKGESAIKIELLERGKGFFWEEDREGRLVLYLLPGKHNKNEQSLEESIHHGLWLLETGRWLRRHDEQLVTVVVDLEDVTMASFDVPLCKFMLECMQRYYPEILGCCLIMNAPWIFWGFWAGVKGFLDPVVANKISFIKREELVDYIRPECIPCSWSMGTCPFQYDSLLPKNNELEDNEVFDQVTLTEEEVQLINQFINLSLSLSMEYDAEKKLERDEVKRQLRRVYFHKLKPVIPQNMYHRWGVLSEDLHINWSLFKL